MSLWLDYKAFALSVVANGIGGMRPLFPFTAIIGQDEMKLALLLAAIDPTIGGVLVFGDRGTGKSTAVRGLAGLTCAYGSDGSSTPPPFTAEAWSDGSPTAIGDWLGAWL